MRPRPLLADVPFHGRAWHCVVKAENAAMRPQKRVHCVDLCLRSLRETGAQPLPDVVDAQCRSLRIAVTELSFEYFRFEVFREAVIRYPRKNCHWCLCVEETAGALLALDDLRHRAVEHLAELFGLFPRSVRFYVALTIAVHANIDVDGGISAPCPA